MDNTTKWQLFTLDSGASYREGASDIFLTYDYIRQDQLDWLSDEHKLVGDNVPCVCYYHIPQKDNDIGYEAFLNNTPGYKGKFFKLEKFAASKYATEMNETFKANNVKAAFMGHAHNNDFTFTNPDGITYGLGVKTGSELYYAHVDKSYKNAGCELEENFDLIGASLVTLNNCDGDFTLEHLYFNERDGSNFVKWVKY